MCGRSQASAVVGANDCVPLHQHEAEDVLLQTATGHRPVGRATSVVSYWQAARRGS